MRDEYLTTTQVAKICHVTRFSIANWVKKGRLKAHKTAGGHRRILKKELIKFIKKNQIVKIDKKDTAYSIPSCWEFQDFKPSGKHNCTNCLAFIEKADKCFLLLREFGSEKIQCQDDCLKCEYLIKYYPYKKKIIERMRKETMDEIESQLKEGRFDIPNLLKKSFYSSGKYLASIGKILSKGERKNISYEK